MKPLLIALHGLPGTGKDTFANRLIEGGGWGRVAFAGPLKRGLAAMLNIPMDDIENPSIKNEPNYKFGRSIRYMAQTLGTEWGRSLIHDDIWLSLGEEAILHQLSLGMNVVNTDLRFPNEAKMIKDMGGYIVHIIRDNNQNADKSAKTGIQSHISDAGIPVDSIDYTIYNNYSLDMFHEECQKVLTEICLNRQLLRV